MTNLSLWVGIIGNITWMLFFLYPAHTFYRIVPNRSTEGFASVFESVPYACALLNAALWTYYGIIKPNSILISTVNGFGIVAETIYLILFLIYAPPNLKGHTVLVFVLVDVVYLGWFVLPAKIILDGEGVIFAMGVLAAAFNIIMYVVVLDIVTTGPRLEPTIAATAFSGEYIPFLPSLFCFFNGGIWSFYAILVKDIFLLVPNAIGFILGTVHLLLYYRFIRRNSNETILSEGGSQQESLLA